jgi:2-polyprenyl-3-methyl-5-hydroxy-6-metoxy-1,4-benzoquinol methylase
MIIGSVAAGTYEKVDACLLRSNKDFATAISGPPMQLTRLAAYTTSRPDVFEMVPPSAKIVLDVGCSNGALGLSLREALPGRRVMGIEGDEALFTEAATRLDSVLHADLNELDWDQAFPGIRFDCIIFADVLEHLIEPQRHLSAAWQRLQAGGAVVVSLPNIRHMTALYSIFIAGTFPRRDRGIFDRTHLRWFTIGDAKALITNAGFIVDDVTYSLRVRDRGDGLLNKIARKLLDPIQGVGPIHEFLAYQSCIRAVRDH